MTRRANRNEESQMKTLELSRYALAIGAASALLAGCGGPQPPIGASGAMPQSRAIATHAKRGTSWMLPDATNENLLYVSLQDLGEVRVFSFPDGHVVGSLDGFNRLGGLCSDASGDVWIGDVDKVFEYPHGGSSPIVTLDNPRHALYISGCSVDSITGDLAIANDDYGSNPGNVGVYKKAQGAPHYYDVFQPQQCAYDGSSDLYCDADARSSFGFGTYRKPFGKNKFIKVSFDRTIEKPGGLQWDGQYLAVGDLTSRVAYRFQVHGRKGRSRGSVTLTGAKWLIEFSIHDSMIAGANELGKSVMIWRYPKGGMPLVAIKRVHPVGVTVSVAPPR